MTEDVAELGKPAVAAMPGAQYTVEPSDAFALMTKPLPDLVNV